jgi:hypothetical protein
MHWWGPWDGDGHCDINPSISRGINGIFLHPDVLGLYGIIWPDVFDPRRSASFLFDRGELWVHGKAMPLPSNAFDLVIDKSLMDTFACAEELPRKQSHCDW